MRLKLFPPDFVDAAADAESWTHTDWGEWVSHVRKLKRAGVRTLTLYAPEVLSAGNGWPFARGSVRLDHSSPKPTLDAVARLAAQLRSTDTPPIPRTRD